MVHLFEIMILIVSVLFYLSSETKKPTFTVGLNVRFISR
ncbi:hypothetical protein VAEKB19_80009 [Vibrio aestuarianus]|nr:hypothetical protein VAEKB19_80009 [Vibrio aestuarianus]